MANIIHACVRFEPQEGNCQTFDWCTNVDLDTETEEDLFARAEFFLANLQANYEKYRGFSKTHHCEYAIVITTVFPE